MIVMLTVNNGMEDWSLLYMNPADADASVMVKMAAVLSLKLASPNVWVVVAGAVLAHHPDSRSYQYPTISIKPQTRRI
jgi:hypothetical protein